MTEMVEKVAREICLAMWGGYPVEKEGREQWSQWEVGMNLARVAIKAMREPTPEMRAAMGSKMDWVNSRADWDAIFPAAIDAALKEQEKVG